MRRVIFACYVLFLIIFVVFSYLFIDPGLLYLKFLFTNFFQLHRVVTTVIFTLCIFCFFGFYAYFLKDIKRNAITKDTVFRLTILSLVILLFAYPAMLSFDIFNYIATAKVTFFYHENPYIVMPIEFSHDPLLLFMHAANKTALYAPFWILLTCIPYFLGFGNFLLILINFKIFSAVFYLATVWLLWHMTKDVFKTALFALNPLVLIESLVSSHNDILMIFFLLASMKLLFEKQKGKGTLLFLLSAGIKYVTIALSPLYLFALFKSVSRKKIYLWTTLVMYLIFFSSSFREEIYPWYSMWFLLPVTFIAGNNLLTWISITFSFSMLLRYIPFMLLGTYFGPTPLLKIVFMLIPVIIAIVTYIASVKQKRFV